VLLSSFKVIISGSLIHFRNKLLVCLVSPQSNV